MPKAGLEQTIIDALEPRGAERGIDVVDVEVVGATKAPCVRVRIDHADESLPTISLDEVTAETEWISAALDELDPIPSSFTLEVSSPGMARPLRKPHDFERFAGETVSASLVPGEGRRRYTGVLLGIEGSTVALECDGERVELALDDIRKCTIKPDFNDAGTKK
ncbi:ribosome maturation factor RimP [Thermophilibacter provencensis]|uniref:Ribosome maturation factor RimP n=1 Tax=Thermophilibacter provencensis TaxID=1852386 RepID=A0ABT7V1F6_9ACTN|nr:ribosome maturation factor RimP [Thermophilibacter provencensis]MDM8270413.1 ribosome maturation factor RimP [Thermophilibacter provencensis]